MNQEFKKKEEEKKKSNIETLREQFKSIKATPQLREVTLSMMLNCGCGGWSFQVKRMVPDDSPLKDGDRIHEADLITGDQYKSNNDTTWVTVK